MFVVVAFVVLLVALLQYLVDKLPLGRGVRQIICILIMLVAIGSLLKFYGVWF